MSGAMSCRGEDVGGRWLDRKLGNGCHDRKKETLIDVFIASDDRGRSGSIGRWMCTVATRSPIDPSIRPRTRERPGLREPLPRVRIPVYIRGEYIRYGVVAACARTYVIWAGYIIRWAKFNHILLQRA